MRSFFRLFRRDLTQRWPLLVTSIVMGLFVVGIALLPQGRNSPLEVRGAASLITALSWCAILAILLGGSIFTRDLTEGRLAFDFRLPARPSAIWAARLLAALVTIALAGGLLLVTPAIAGMDFAGAAGGFEELIGNGPGVSTQSALVFAPLALLVLLLLANPLALAATGRQNWAAVDLLSLGLLGVAAAWSWHAPWWIGAMLLAFTALGAAVASYRQVTSGRTEADRAQKSLSLILFAAAIGAASTVFAFSVW